MTVTVFGNETDAYNGLSALKNLHKNGDITLYGDVLIKKNDVGEVSVEDMDEKGPIGTALGLTLGSLIGLLGGPAAAVVAGTAGGMTGMLYDMDNAGVDSEFIDDVSEAIIPGTVAILANIEEEWTTPLDTKMLENQGITFRRLRSDVEYLQWEREIVLENEVMNELIAEFNDSVDADKASIKKHFEKSKAKLKAIADRVKGKIDTLINELDEKVEILEAQIDNATDENKKKIKAQVAKLKADHEARVDKLNRAWEAAKTELNKKI